MEERFFETDNHKLMAKVCNNALKTTENISLVSNTGYGKTTSLLKISEKNPRIHYLRVYKSWTSKLMMFNICKKLEIECKSYESLYFLTKKVHDYNNMLDSQQLLIFDEFNKLNANKIKFITELMNVANSKLSFLFSVNESFYKNSLPRFLSNNPELKVFHNRISHVVPLSPPTHDEIISISKLYNINDNEFIKHLLTEVNDHRKLTNMLKQYFRDKKN